tara:strand:+ start:6618 stop:6818 length:201 start_codon:yes stop_codon:yes gene_type:complete
MEVGTLVQLFTRSVLRSEEINIGIILKGPEWRGGFIESYYVKWANEQDLLDNPGWMPATHLKRFEK